ncbi:MAG: ATP-binding cassette domain-containing protein [Syntrophomonas sp.]
MFSLQDIVLHYGPLRVFEHFNLSCSRQEFICLFGPSGVGKTTILNLLAGVARPQAGRVRSNSRRLAYVFQEPRLLPWFTAVENLQLGLYNLGLDARQRRQRVESLLPVLGLDGFGDYYPGQLSGGMKQRVSIGRAFAIQPDLLLLDEPFSGLDENLKKDMEELLLSLGRWHACTTVLVTHDVQEAVRLADRIVVVGGRPCETVLELRPETGQKSKPSYARHVEQVLINTLNPDRAELYL